MSDVMAIASQAVSQSNAQIAVQAQVALLKDLLDFQKETAAQLLDLLGVGGNLDIEA